MTVWRAGDGRVRPGDFMSARPACLAVRLLAGCGTLGSRPREAEAALPGQFTSAAGRSVSAAELDRWWTLYNDPELTQLTEAALSASTDVRAAFARLEEAQAQRSSRRRQVAFPTGELTGSASVTGTEQLEGGSPLQPAGPSNAQSLEFPVSWELDLFGRRRVATPHHRGHYLSSRFLYEAHATRSPARWRRTVPGPRPGPALADAQETQRIAVELARVARIRSERGLAPTSESARRDAELAARSPKGPVAGRPALAPGAPSCSRRKGDARWTPLPITPNLYDKPETPAVSRARWWRAARTCARRRRGCRPRPAALSQAELALLPTINLRPSLGATGRTPICFRLGDGLLDPGANLLVPILDRPRLLAEIEVTARAPSRPSSATSAPCRRPSPKPTRR